MTLDTFNKGGSIPRVVTLTDGTDNLDTSILTTIEVKVFNTLHKGISTYTLAGGTVATIVPSTTGQIFFVVPETESADIRACLLYTSPSPRDRS